MRTQEPRPVVGRAPHARFEVWLGCRWTRLSRGGPYVEYAGVRRCLTRTEAERVARREGADSLVHDRVDGWVWTPALEVRR